MKIKTLLLLSLRIFLGGIFLVSGLQKLLSPYQNFAAVIEKFEVLKGPSVVWLARSLPWAEFVAGLFFATGFWESAALFVLWAMNMVFLAVLGSAILRKLPLDTCGCFGEAISLTLPQIFSLDLVFCALFFLYFFLSRRQGLPGLDRLYPPHGRP